MMELWEMTFKQYREHLLENNKYKNAYQSNVKMQELWESYKNIHLREWINVLLERAEIGVIPSDVLMSYIRNLSESDLFRTFRGTKSKGIEEFRIPKKIKDSRESKNERKEYAI